MPFSRRRFLLLLSAANLLAPFRHVLAASISLQNPPVEPAYRRSFDAWIETLMPADEFSPGGGEMGVPIRIVEKAAMNRDYLKLIKAGCRWLDANARDRGGPNFAGLSEAGREAVVRLAENSSPGSMQRLFFKHTLKDAFFYYYARRESWLMLGYGGPPQPRGFMDHTQPPPA